MKKIHVGSELPRDVNHLVLTITDEPVALYFLRMIDDVLISSPEGDILISWDIDHDSEWDDENCMLLTVRDNMKEIGNIKTSLFALKARDRGGNLNVYFTVKTN